MIILFSASLLTFFLKMQAAAVADTASKSIAELQDTAEESEPSKEVEGVDTAATEKESEDEDDKVRKSALEKLEKAGDDSIFSQARHIRTLHFSFLSNDLDGRSLMHSI